MRTQDETGAWSWLAYTLASAGDEGLICLEASRSGLDEEPIGVLSRWGADPGPDSLPDLVVESAVADPAVDLRQRAADAFSAWRTYRLVVLGDFSRGSLVVDRRAPLDALSETDEALVIDGVPVAGTLARAGDLHARLVDRGDHAVVVVHHGRVGLPVRLARGMPQVKLPAM
jgi:hypothetical protein